MVKLNLVTKIKCYQIPTKINNFLLFFFKKRPNNEKMSE